MLFNCLFALVLVICILKCKWLEEIKLILYEHCVLDVNNTDSAGSPVGNCGIVSKIRYLDSLPKFRTSDCSGVHEAQSHCRLSNICHCPHRDRIRSHFCRHCVCNLSTDEGNYITISSEMIC